MLITPNCHRVLIVDDDRTTLDHYSRMLKLEGYEVQTAEDGEAGLELAIRDPPDAILLDLRMPIVDGAEFLRRLRRSPGLADIPVAIVTGDYFVEDRIGYVLANLRARVVYKPLWVDEIVELARSLIGNDDGGQRDRTG
jgi:two-component system response regulator MprA